MASPVGFNHGSRSSQTGWWLRTYASRTPGVRASHDATVDLGRNRVCQPDHLLRIREECGGRSRRVGKFLAGPPELVVEIAAATLRDDLGPQLLDYQNADVAEYVVFALDPGEIHWHVLENGRYLRIGPGPDGAYRSRAFPGLRLDPRAYWSEDDSALLEALEQGLASPEHAAFVDRLRAAAARTESE